MAELAEFYFHIRDIERTSDQDWTLFQHLADQCEDVSEEVAKKCFPDASRLELEFEEGSFKGWVKVFGRIGTVLAGTYGAFALYPDFEDGLIRACRTAERFGSDICSGFIDTLDQKDIVTLRRKGVPGAIVRVSQELESLITNKDDLSTEELDYHRYRISKRIERIASSLSGKYEKKLVVSYLLQKAEPLKLPISEEQISALEHTKETATQDLLYPTDNGYVSRSLAEREHIRNRTIYVSGPLHFVAKKTIPLSKESEDLNMHVDTGFVGYPDKLDEDGFQSETSETKRLQILSDDC